MKLIHYSSSALDIIDPEHFGQNSFTLNDYKVSDRSRSFWYTENSEIESFFSGYLKYTVEYDENRIYDLRIDKHKLVKIAQSLNNGVLNFDRLFKLIIGNGYHGVIYNQGTEVVTLFVPVRIK